MTDPKDQEKEPVVDRRAVLQAGLAAGAIPFVGLPAARLPAVAKHDRGVVYPRHVRPRAKRVILLCQSGGPSHLESFDFKPRLIERDGEPMPTSFTKGQPIAQLQGQKLRVQRPLCKFAQHGESGQWVSDFFPWTAKVADKIAVVRSMHTTQINHDPANTVMNTGTQLSGRPSLGSWLCYGLGTEAPDLPGFVVLTSTKGRNPQPIASRQWHSGFLPSQFQGVEFQAAGAPVHYLETPNGLDRDQQRGVIDTISELDRLRYEQTRDAEIAARRVQYELAYRMQRSVPELTDFSDEPEHILELYGTRGGDGSYASNCLLARRLAERGARCIQLYHRGWDHHGGLEKFMGICSRATDQASAALILDLEQRGMLEDTLVVWGGEFGRTPMAQSKGGVGRDHHIKGFSMWLAGGGIAPGTSLGATDEFGYHAVEDRVSVHDLHATILHLMGIDHERFAVEFQGLQTKLTGVEPSRVVRGLLG